MSGLYQKEYYPKSKNTGCYGEYCCYHEDAEACKSVLNGKDPKDGKKIEFRCRQYMILGGKIKE